MSKNILLLSAYDAASHRYWRLQLQQQLAEFNWTQLALPPRHFNWRIRSNAMQWASQEQAHLSRNYDLVIATSMVDLATLRGLVPPFAQIPCLLYFHENQFAYPAGQQRKDNVEPQLVPIYSVLCAQGVAFNSTYNRDTFIAGARALSQRLPEALPQKLFDNLDASLVLPVPLANPPQHQARDPGSALPAAASLEVVWNHRWEYDKGVDLLAQVVELTRQQNLPIRFHLVGQQFRAKPKEFADIEKNLEYISRQTGAARGNFGFIEDQVRYQQLLADAHVVLSTAHHDFQGLAVQEACLVGCIPVVPDALVYPEYIPEHLRFAVTGTKETIAAGVIDKLMAIRLQLLQGERIDPVDLHAYQGECAISPYRELIKNLSG